MRKLIYLLLFLTGSIFAQSSKVLMYQGNGTPYNNPNVSTWVGVNWNYQKTYWDKQNYRLYVYDNCSESWVLSSPECQQTPQYEPPYKHFVAIVSGSGYDVVLRPIFNNTGYTFAFNKINAGFYAINYSQDVPDAYKVVLYLDNQNSTFLKTYNSNSVTLNRVDQPYTDYNFMFDTLEIRIYNLN